MVRTMIMKIRNAAVYWSAAFLLLAAASVVAFLGLPRGPIELTEEDHVRAAALVAALKEPGTSIEEIDRRLKAVTGGRGVLRLGFTWERVAPLTEEVLEVWNTWEEPRPVGQEEGMLVRPIWMDPAVEDVEECWPRYGPYRFAAAGRVAGGPRWFRKLAMLLARHAEPGDYYIPMDITTFCAADGSEILRRPLNRITLESFDPHDLSFSGCTDWFVPFVPFEEGADVSDPEVLDRLARDLVTRHPQRNLVYRPMHGGLRFTPARGDGRDARSLEEERP